MTCVNDVPACCPSQFKSMEMGTAIDSTAWSIALKPTLHEIIISRRDVFVTLPTGSGMSFCFILLLLVFDHLLSRSGSIVLCVSPGISYDGAMGDAGYRFVRELQQDIMSMQSFQKGPVQIIPKSLISNP